MVPGTRRKLFLSHSTNDDALVRELRAALADLGHDVWIDSRELRGGSILWPDIQQAIADAAGYAVLVSPAGLKSDWVGKELRHAIKVQAERGKHKYPVIPLSLDGTPLGALGSHFDDEPLHVRISSAPGGIAAGLHDILVALGVREPNDVTPPLQPRAEPLEDLVLELSDLAIVEVREGVRRSSGRARLIYQPAAPGQREVTSAQPWRFTAPLGPIEADELRWYLEKYAIWPSHVFRARARAVEQNLIAWGRQLYDAAMPEPTANVRVAWAKVNSAGRRFSIHVDAARELGAPEAEVATSREAATLLLGLPWELLHDGDSFLFQGAQPTRVRRRLPNTRVLDIAAVATPIRILLVAARPDDGACTYLDHRSSALPLVQAMEELPDQVELHILEPPTLPALREELDRARRDGEPYHVLHFDGHGVYDRRAGLGGLCFEDAADAGALEYRRHATVHTDVLGPLLRDHRIPLVFLEACQTAQSDSASESVAAEMLQRGVASVIAMSHSVLVATACRFVAAFYGALARGARVGDAMLEGQRHLKDDTLRGRIFGAGELRLEDWFVPVLFQEREDPQLFRQMPAKQTVQDFQARLANRIGESLRKLEPTTGFVGRSRDLLALERLLVHERYAVLRGQGGEGKTALAAELARWMVRSQRLQRSAFVSVEAHATARAVLDVLGQQLVPSYSVAIFTSLAEAERPVAAALAEQRTLLVIDNLESILAPLYRAADAPDALAKDARGELTEILALCERLCDHGDTRLVLTSREPLPAPFDGTRNRRELHRLALEDAIQLVERVVHDGAGTSAITDAERVEIEELVEAVHGHARTLALLAPSLHRIGVVATREKLVELMADMHRRFPGQREQSLFASVELSLRRLSPASRQRVRVLGVFHGAVDLDVLRVMMEWDQADVTALARELVETGLATPNRYNHLSLDPALCPYLRSLLEESELAALMDSWMTATFNSARYLCYEMRGASAATLTRQELPNLIALLTIIANTEDVEKTFEFASCLEQLLGNGRPRLVAWAREVRTAAAARISTSWSHVRFTAEQLRVMDQLNSSELEDGLASAQALLQRARSAGEHAYPLASYDLALACYVLARALHRVGNTEAAVPCFEEAQHRFEAIHQRDSQSNAARMAAVSLIDRGVCLGRIGRLDEAAQSCEEAIGRAEQRHDEEQLAVGNAHLGRVRMDQHRFQDALMAYSAARRHFTNLDRPLDVAGPGTKRVLCI